jgi:hypothetical protein
MLGMLSLHACGSTNLRLAPAVLLLLIFAEHSTVSSVGMLLDRVLHSCVQTSGRSVMQIAWPCWIYLYVRKLV